VEDINRILNDLMVHAEDAVSNVLVNYEDVCDQLSWVGGMEGYSSDSMARIKNDHEDVMSKSKTTFIDEAARMEIGALNFLKMAKGIFTVDPPIDMCGGMSQLIDNEWHCEECSKCGNMTQRE
jgi:hypothetical protein